MKNNVGKMDADLQITDAARILGRIYLSLVKMSKSAKNPEIAQLGHWAIPGSTDVRNTWLLTAISDQYGPYIENWDKLKQYRLAFYGVIIPALQKSSAIWAKDVLEIHEGTLWRLAARLQRQGIDKGLHQAAQRIEQKVGEFKPNKQEVQEGYDRRKAVIGSYLSENDLKNIEKYGITAAPADVAPLAKEIDAAVRKRIAPAVREELTMMQPKDTSSTINSSEHVSISQKEVGELLAILFAHPKGISILSAYSRPGTGGTEIAVELVKDAAMATREFREELGVDPNHIWRYSAIVLGGVTRLHLQEIPGFPEYAVAISRVLGENIVEKVIRDLGPVLMCLGLVFAGPAGAIAIGMMDLALNSAAIAMAFLREREQELGAKASEFREEGKEFAESSGYKDTLLSGAAALLSAVAIISGAKTLGKAKGQASSELPVTGEISKHSEAELKNVKKNLMRSRGENLASTAKAKGTTSRGIEERVVQQAKSDIEKSAKIVTPTHELDNPELIRESRSVDDRNTQKRDIEHAISEQSKGTAQPAIVDDVSQGSCFVAGTRILTPSGHVSIEDLEAGQHVISINRSSDVISKQKITEKFVRMVDRVHDILIKSDESNSLGCITCTAEHPFWIKGKGWHKAGELRTGEILVSNTGQAIVRVESVSSRYGSFTVYNITVAGEHTFCVSDFEIVVHNKAMRRRPDPSEIDWNRYRSDNRYKTYVDAKYDIPSGRTSGTSEAGQTDILREQYRKLNIEIPKGNEPHHIVPMNDPRALEAQEILGRAGIDLDSLENSVILPRGINAPNPEAAIRHEFTFTQEYINKITSRLRKAEENGKVISELTKIRVDLQNANKRLL